MLRVLDPFRPPVVPCYATEDAVQIVNSFITIFTHVTTGTHNYSLRCVTFTQLAILHVSIPFLTSTHIHTSYKHSVHTFKLSPRTYSADSLLKTPLEN
jgi:hypothetical protein